MKNLHGENLKLFFENDVSMFHLNKSNFQIYFSKTFSLSFMFAYIKTKCEMIWKETYFEARIWYKIYVIAFMESKSNM